VKRAELEEAVARHSARCRAVEVLGFPLARPVQPLGDSTESRTVTAYKKGEVPPARPEDFTKKATATSKGGRRS
jgi:hypothetical protein